MYKKISYSIMQEASNYAFDHSIPLYTTLELTQDCNFACKHCYNFDRSDHSKRDHVDTPLTLEEWKSIVDQVIDQGAFYIAFTGGEPLRSPYLFDLIRQVRAHHCIAKLKTNGTLLNESILDQLYETGVYSLEVSLYGASEQSYQKFTGVSSYSKVTKGIDAALKRGMDVTLNILLHKENYKEIGEMIHFAKSRDLRFNISDEITERYDGTGGETLLRLTGNEQRWLLQSEFKQYFDYDNQEHSVQCSCARTVCGINYKGDVYPCIGAPVLSGNLKHSTFDHIWNHSSKLQEIRDLKKDDFIECMQCEFIEKCSRSSGTVFVNTGSYTGCEEYTRNIAELRTKLLSVKK